MAFTSSFVVIDADATCAQARQLLTLSFLFAVVHRRDTDAVYAFTQGELSGAIGVPGSASSPNDTSIRDALRLDGRAPTAIAWADGALPDDLAIVIDRGRVVAIFKPEQGQQPTLEHLAPRGIDFLLGVTRDPRATRVASPRDFIAQLPARIAKDTTAKLRIMIGAIGAHTTGAATIAAARGDTIDVEVEASGAVVLEGPSQLAITIDTDDEIEHGLDVRGAAIGAGHLTVRAYQGTRRVAMVTATVEVVAAPPVASPRLERSSPIVMPGLPPDLEIEITEHRAERQYAVTLNGGNLGLNRVRFGPITLDRDVDTFFTELYRDIENLLRSARPAAEREDALAQLGVYLYEKVTTPELRARLWPLRDQIKTVRIQSEEPWVPWEMCRLSNRDANGVVSEDQFIAEKYYVTRWFLEVPEVRTIRISEIGLVVPHDSGLVAAPAERLNVNSLGSDEHERFVEEIPCDPFVLRQKLGTGKYDVLHFVGHGAHGAGDADRSSLALSDGSQFTPRDLAGRVANFGRAKPLVILNACEVGRSGTTLGGLSGWPQAFVRSGAAAFIGPLWKTVDATAAEFAREIYERLLEGKTLGVAVNEARHAVRSADDPTWLAFTVYGHPDAKYQPAADSAPHP